MTEADITEQMTMMMELTLSGISVFFTIVSAYTVALFYFLGRASMGLKLTAFGFFSLTLLFLAVFAYNSFNHAEALREALVELGATTDLSAVGDKAIGSGVYGRGDIDKMIRGMMWLGLGLVYVAMFFFTFFHRWRDRGAAAAAGAERST
ncbi:MAG: hypothetical protein ACK4NP_14765 [Parvularculaceae bacterium]